MNNNKAAKGGINSWVLVPKNFNKLPKKPLLLPHTTMYTTTADLTKEAMDHEGGEMGIVRTTRAIEAGTFTSLAAVKEYLDSIPAANQYNA